MQHIRHCERNRSNPSRSKRIGGLLHGACHRARIRATRWLAMTVDTPSRSRRMVLREVLLFVPPSSIRGRGEAGRPMRPIAACANGNVVRTRVSQVTPESPGTPRAVVYSLYALSPAIRPGFVTVACGNASRKLDASLEASGPHDFAIRFTRRSLSAHPRPPQPAPRP
jgi:hypothetical protein